MLHRLPALLGVAALASCSAPDDPDNVALKGEWEASLRVSSVRVGPHYLTGDALPSEFHDMAEQTRICTEPSFASDKLFREDIADKLDGKCVIDDYQVTPTSMRAAGRCQQVGDPVMDYSPALNANGSQGRDHYKMVIQLGGVATIPDAGRRDLVMTVVFEGRRLGDC